MFTEGFSILRLELLIMSWILFHRSVLLWCWENNWKFSLCVLFFFGVEHAVTELAAVPCSSMVMPVQWKRHHRSLHFLGVGFSVVNLRSVILWCWRLCVEFYNGSVFFFGIGDQAPEITAVPCTSRVLASSAINSTPSVYSSATSWQGWKMKICATRKAAVRWKNTLLKSSYWLCSPMVVSLLQYD